MNFYIDQIKNKIASLEKALENSTYRTDKELKELGDLKLTFDSSLRYLYVEIITNKIKITVDNVEFVSDVRKNSIDLHYRKLRIHIKNDYYLFLRVESFNAFNDIFVTSFVHTKAAVELHNKGFLTDSEFDDKKIYHEDARSGDTEVGYIEYKYINVDHLINDIRRTIAKFKDEEL